MVIVSRRMRPEGTKSSTHEETLRDRGPFLKERIIPRGKEERILNAEHLENILSLRLSF